MQRTRFNMWMMTILVLVSAALSGCTRNGVSESAPVEAGDASAANAEEATSLLGEPLLRPELPDDERIRLEANLTQAETTLSGDPENPDNLVWVGRRLAYLWRYKEAIEVFSRGIENFPRDPRFYRHRGHRYITLRRFDDAIADLEKAVVLIQGMPDEVEPDGDPNPQNIPRSTLHTNIWYHLGLARYLMGDFEGAASAYEECRKASDNDDMRVAASDWLYMSYRRLGLTDKADEVLEPINADMEILENTAYHRRLLMYKGELKPEEVLNPAEPDALQLATQGYGVGNWYLYNGDSEKASEIFRSVLSGSYWAAFGFIASEVEVHRGTRSGG